MKDWEDSASDDWRLIHSFRVNWECMYDSLQNRRYIHIHGWRDQESDEKISSSEVHEIFDLETGLAYPFTPHSHEKFYTDEPVAVVPSSQHILARSENEGKNRFLRVLRIKDFTEVLRFPLPSEFKAISNITSDGRFAVLTAANELLRLQLHLPSQATS